ncbi:ribonuclease E/G [Oecophyllibacter saccharovorans]|uniref:ribonuclease E/G n=1 Tax=Oecophyllibacter saccharovorans TaxID=2558360 RepID=UPI00116DC01F|nr:ribonuclease E/G [Oecophyllibacter saccharovorans]TPW33678.1 hypothetical protein E3203_07640 [Oecophyllibacter saccharovorans]
MGVDLYLTGSPGEIRATVLDADAPDDAAMLACALWRPGRPDGWGARHLARVTASAPELGGVFVELAGGPGGSLQEGFLPAPEKLRREKLQEGALVAAEVIRSAQNGKGLRLRCLPPGTPLPQAPAGPVLLSAGPTPLEELAAAWPQAAIYADSAATAARLPPELRKRLAGFSGFPPGTSEILAAQWDRLSQPTVRLGPLLAHITPTPALYSIDLDTGPREGVPGGGSARNGDFNTNVAAFPALARELQLRNLSGTLLVDPAGVPTRKRPALVPFLKRALEDENDPLGPRVTGATPSGLLEITRPRRRPPLHELLNSPHGQGLALLRTILQQDLQGTELHAQPAVIAALQADPQALDMFNRQRAASLQTGGLRLVATPLTNESRTRAWQLV